MICTEKRSSFFLTPNGLAVSGVMVTGSKPATKFSTPPRMRSATLARARGADSRQVGAEPSAPAVDAVTAGAQRAKQLLAVLGPPAGRRCGGRGERAQVRQDLPDSSSEARVGRHLGARHAA